MAGGVGLFLREYAALQQPNTFSATSALCTELETGASAEPLIEPESCVCCCAHLPMISLINLREL